MLGRITDYAAESSRATFGDKFSVGRVSAKKDYTNSIFFCIIASRFIDLSSVPWYGQLYLFLMALYLGAVLDFGKATDGFVPFSINEPFALLDLC